MVDRGGLENRCTFTGTVGSNPTLSANGIVSTASSLAVGEKPSERYVWCACVMIEDRQGGYGSRALPSQHEVVLGGEVAVPCRPQSAIAGLNPS